MIRRLTIVMAVVLLASSALAQVDLTRNRTRTKATSTLQMLNQSWPEVRFVDLPLEQVFEWLAEFTDMNVVVRWETLIDAGVDRDTPISLQVRNLRLSQVLWLILNEAGGSELVLAYRASGNLLVISTEEDLGKEMVTKVYDVSDLLVRPPSAGRPDFQSQSQGLQAGGQGGGSQNIFGGNTQQNRNQQEQVGQDVQIGRLIEVIQSTVEPDSWADAGGHGTIETFGNLLIVRNTILVHQQLGGYLTEDEVVGP